jgi:hypothetical protein
MSELDNFFLRDLFRRTISRSHKFYTAALSIICGLLKDNSSAPYSVLEKWLTKTNRCQAILRN